MVKVQVDWGFSKDKLPIVFLMEVFSKKYMFLRDIFLFSKLNAEFSHNSEKTSGVVT